jgi:O-acetyl-ADP-ribose deacetylase
MDAPRFFLQGRVLVKTGDITREEVDAIVNAANSSLMGGGGVDGAIHRAGGPEIKTECEKIRRSEYPAGLPAGEAVITTAGKMAVKYIIHTVGPVYGRGGADKPRLLASCYNSALRLAAEKGLKTIAFPAISTGAYGYPLDAAARVSSKAIEESLATDNSFQEVRLVFFSESATKLFLQHQAFSK